LKLGASLQPLSRFIGKWKGTGSGDPGNSTVERTYASVLGGNFIEVRNRSTYAPQEKNPKSEAHDDTCYFSFDRARKSFVFRLFHVEGCANQSLSQTPDFAGSELVMISEAIENIGAGFRARETFRFSSANAFEEIFEIAEPGKGFAVYSHNKLARA